MKRILVPVDFSKEAENAAQVAISIAKKSGGEVFLLHMLELPETTEFMLTSRLEPMFFIDLAKKHFSEFLKLPIFKSVKVHTKILHYRVFNGIKDEVKALNIDLIVMGTRGSTGLAEIIIGSNTEKVVRCSNVPVLVIKEPHKNFNIKQLVFASDFSLIGQKSFKKVIDFCNFFGAEIHLLFVNTVYNFEKTEDTLININKFINGYELSNYTVTIYNDTSVERGIISYSKSINADAIALNTTGQSGLSKLFNGSIASELANHAMLPVVTFKI